MAEACELLGVRKAAQGLIPTLVLAGLAGAFVALGAMLFTIVMTEPGLGYGPARLLGGVAFSLGLILVIIAGAELFTGNTLIVMACANRRISIPAVLRNWGLVYAGNFAGSVLTALLVLGSRQWEFNGAEVGGTALRIAHSKVNLGFGEAILLGILCNVLVTLAVWLTLGARSNTDKILSIVFPITGFVAAGFEHSIANMYFIPVGILLKDQSTAVEASGVSPADLDSLTWGSFLFENLLPVTIGNIIGGAVLVAGVYWFVFLRPGRART
jgi:formate/nitrite transporter